MTKLLIVLAAVLLFNCDNSKKIQTERETPTAFLSIKEEPWPKGTTVVGGTLTNSASATDYANIVLLVHYYSEDNKNIGTERLVEFNILKPDESREYKHKIHPPILTERIETTIDRAQFVDYDEKTKF